MHKISRKYPIHGISYRVAGRYSCASSHQQKPNRMRKALTLLSVAAVAALAFTQQSCRDIIANAFNAFNTKPHEIKLTIPVITTANSSFVVFDTVQTRIDLESEIRAATDNTYGIDDIETITITDLRVALDGADADNNWANFSDVEFKLISPMHNFRETIGSKRGIPDTYASELTLDASGEAVNVAQYLSGEVLYEISGINRRPTTKEIGATAFVTFRISAIK